MDALGGYGSDSSSSADGGISGGGVATKPAAAQTPSAEDNANKSDNPMSALLGLPDASSSEDESTTKASVSKRPRIEASAESISSRGGDAGVKPSSSSTQLLPAPPLSSDSVLRWPKNYLKPSDTHFLPPATGVTAEMKQTRQRLEALLQDQTKTQKTYSQKLQEQQEFHNPHFFAATVKEAGIQNPLGSHLSRKKKALEDWELELVGRRKQEVSSDTQENRNGHEDKGEEY